MKKKTVLFQIAAHFQYLLMNGRNISNWKKIRDIYDRKLIFPCKKNKTILRNTENILKTLEMFYLMGIEPILMNRKITSHTLIFRPQCYLVRMRRPADKIANKKSCKSKKAWLDLRHNETKRKILIIETLYTRVPENRKSVP